jgi:hypothetical protein
MPPHSLLFRLIVFNLNSTFLTLSCQTGRWDSQKGATEDAWDPSDEQEEGGRKTTAYIWDSMDEEDREDAMDILKQSDEWVIWKSRDKWTTLLNTAAFHQLLYIKKDIQE